MTLNAATPSELRKRGCRTVSPNPNIEIREGSTPETVIFSGYSVRWDEQAEIYDWLGKYLESFRQGAFKKTISERGPVSQGGNGQIKFVRQHNYGIALAAKVLALREDDNTGLFFEAETINTTTGRDFAEELRSGVIDTVSNGFDSIVEEWNFDAEPEERVVIEARLYEISGVNWPAYAGAKIDKVRALDRLPAFLEAVEAELRAGGIPTKAMIQRVGNARDLLNGMLEGFESSDDSTDTGPSESPPEEERNNPAPEEVHAANTRLRLLEREIEA